MTSRSLLRRQFLSGLGAAPLALRAAVPGAKTVGAVVTEYRHWSHADVVVGRLLGGNSANGVHHDPRTHVVSLFTAQVPQNDMSRDLAARFGFHIYPTIAETLTLGKPKLAVDNVVFIGEHGNYPSNDAGQKLYPRHELFSQVLDEFERSGRSVPVFFDKHFSYSWPKAKEMYGRARKLRFPFMAGSSIPVTPRTPPLELPYGAGLTHALALGYADLDAYGFHTLEALQCMVERRKGGETGIRSVELIEGDRVWQWRDSDKGNWSKPLLEAALDRVGVPISDLAKVKSPAVFRLDYNDGLQAAAYMLTGAVSNWAFAGQITGQPQPLATRFGPEKPDRPLPHFDGLVYCVENMFVTRQEPWPVERTLLTTGALAFLFESRRRKQAVDTPELSIAYRSPERIFVQKA